MIRKPVKVGMSDEEKQLQADDIYGRVMGVVNPHLEAQDSNITDKFAEQDQIITERLDAQDDKIAQTQDQTPRYVDSSANILLQSENKGIALSTDNNHWYYWNGSAYVDSGYEYRNTGQNLVSNNTTKGSGANTVIQLHPENNPNDNLYPSLNEKDRKILYERKNVIVYDYNNFYAEQNKYYTGVGDDNTVLSNPSPMHKCIKVDIFDDKAFLKFEMLTEETTGIAIGFLEKKDGTFISFNIFAKDEFISLIDVKTIYLNLFVDSSMSPMLKYEMIFIEDRPLENLNDVYEITNTTYGCKGGLISIGRITKEVINKHYDFELENFQLTLNLEENVDSVGHTFGVVEFLDGTIIDLGTKIFDSRTFYSVKKISLNLLKGVVKSYTIKKIIKNDSEITIDDVKDYKVFNKENSLLNEGYYSNCDNVKFDVLHQSTHIKLSDKASKLLYIINDVPLVSVGFIKYGDLCVSLPSKVGQNEVDIKGTADLYFNFFGGGAYPNEFVVKYSFPTTTITEEKITLNHCVNKPFDFNGANICFFGDSITQGFTSGTTKTQNNYPKLFSNKVGATFDNKGIGGSTLSQVDGYTNMSTVIKTTDLSPYYAIFIALGINDWQLGVTEEKFRNEIESLCEFIKTNYTGEVIFIAPINHIDNGLYGRDSVTNVDVFRRVIYEYTTKYDFSFVNGGNFNFLSENTPYANSLFGDGLHPTELGYKLYAKSLVDVLL